jgi:hypothetical protein
MSEKAYLQSRVFASSILVALLLVPMAVSAVECVGDRTYETAVDDGCTSITGNLRITGLPLTNVDGLSALSSVGLDLFIYNSDTLRNLDGLSALTSVGNDLSIVSNEALTNLEGLSALTSVGANLYLSSNDALTGVDGLSALASVHGSLGVANNDALTNVDGLSALTFVSAGLFIERNNALTNVDGLSGIASIGSDLSIFSNDALRNVDGLATLTFVGGNLYIAGNLNLCQGSVDKLLGRITTSGWETPQPNYGYCGCKAGIAAYKPLLKATNFATPEADDKLNYRARLIFTEAVALKPETQGFRLVVEDANAKVLADIRIPAGLYDPLTRSGWIPAPSGKKFQYITKTPVDGIVPKVILKWNPNKSPSEVVVIVKGKKGDFAVQPVALPLKASLSLDPTNALTTLCAEAEFPGTKPLPHCRMVGNGASVICK